MSSVPLTHEWAAPQWDWPLQHHDGVVKVHNSATGFEVGLDCAYYTPNEIDVKVAGQEVVISCKHEVRTDSHGTVTRQLQRAYKLPDDVDPSTLKSSLNARGVLTITAGKKH